MTGIDQSVAETVSSVGKRWGGRFEVEIVDDWKGVARQWKRAGGVVAHLTMYGVNVDVAMKSLRRKRKDVLVIIGSEKVPREAYELADYNMSVGSQPHSEIAALAIFLDRIFRGKELVREFSGGRLKIIPNEKGKVVHET